jgi:predicted ribosome quality control (RQC) complex YloA/Tae2 family protein
MPLDSICLTALLNELRPQLIGGRIDKIYQTGKDEIELVLRTAAGNKCLFLSANPHSCRLGFVSSRAENPQNPPMFCMLLRKHLSGARIVSVDQPAFERLVYMRMECYDELGERVQKTLIFEAIGQRSNLLLLGADGRILGMLRRFNTDLSSQGRHLMPGFFYEPLETQDKRSIMDCDPPEGADEKYLLANFSGLSPLLCRELSSGVRDMRESVKELRRRLRENDFQPVLLKIEGVIKDFYFMPINQYGSKCENIICDDFSSMLQEFYREKDESLRAMRRGKELYKTVSSIRDRTARRLMNQKRELAQSIDREYLRKCGDLITANLHSISPGQNVLIAQDFYENDCPDIEIRLDPSKSAQQNAAQYYKKYKKAKTAEKVLNEQIKLGEAELVYLESALFEISAARDEHELAEIRRELESAGIIRASAGSNKRKTQAKASAPIEYRTTSGLRVLVGRNNMQNDELTLKTAGKRDLWFHTKNVPGAHVILMTAGGEADEVSISEAAAIAVWHSGLKGKGSAAVDYCPVKNVKKPAGARPGMVIYENYKTIITEGGLPSG